MNDEQFEKGLKKYRELTLEIEKEKEEIKSDDITKLYHEEVEQKLYDDINDLVQSRFSEEGYFILNSHKKSFSVAVSRKEKDTMVAINLVANDVFPS